MTEIPQTFITGSRVYGMPKRNSDLDMVIRMQKEELHMFFAVDKDCNTSNAFHKEMDYPEDSVPFRFGELNLIVVTNDEMHKAWWDATEELKQIAPVSREKAIEVHKRHRQKVKHND